jgi:hypothetical protein
LNNKMAAMSSTSPLVVAVRT